MDVKSVAVVTGASQGIGKATALRLARDFAAVLLVARDKESLETAAREVRSAGVETEFLAADLREPQAAETVVKGPMHANNLNRTNADRPGVDLSAFFSAKVAKKEEDAVKRREFLSVISSASFAATLGCSLADFARAQDSAPADGKAIDTGSFEGSQVAVAGNTIYVRRYGEGPAILMVHGFPRTSLMWRHLAPQLAENHTVICADLRAYGRSGTPASTDDHIPYSKRAMAKELVDVMMKLGFPSFTLIGHDRGGRVSYRMALDHPKSVERLAVFDVIPIYEAWSRADARFAQTYWPWILLSQKQPLPESYLLGTRPRPSIATRSGRGRSGRKFWTSTCRITAIRRACTESAKNIEPLRRSTWSTTAQTKMRREKSNVRCCTYGLKAGRSTRFTRKRAGRWESGASGLLARTARQ